MGHTAGVMVADLVLRYLEAVEWPVVVVLMVVLFRRSIRTVLGRLSELSGAGVSAKFQTEAERLAGRAAAMSAERDPFTLSWPETPTWQAPPVSPPWDHQQSSDSPSPYAPPSYAPPAPYGPSAQYGSWQGGPQQQYPPLPATSGYGQSAPPAPYSPQPDAYGFPAPAQAGPPGEPDTVVPPPLSRSGDGVLDHMPWPDAPPLDDTGKRRPAPRGEPDDAGPVDEDLVDEDEETRPTVRDTAGTAEMPRTHPPETSSTGEHAGRQAVDRHAGDQAATEDRDRDKTSDGAGTADGNGGSRYGDAETAGTGDGGHPATDGRAPGEAVPPPQRPPEWPLQQGAPHGPPQPGPLQQRPPLQQEVRPQRPPPPPPYAAYEAREPVAVGGSFATARARADADPAGAIGLAWRRLRTAIADLARGRSMAPRSGVHAQLAAVGAGADVADLVRELDEMRRDAAAGTAPVTAAAARAYVTAAEHVTAVLPATANR